MSDQKSLLIGLGGKIDPRMARMIEAGSTSNGEEMVVSGWGWVWGSESGWVGGGGGGGATRKSSHTWRL